MLHVIDFHTVQVWLPRVAGFERAFHDMPPFLYHSTFHAMPAMNTGAKVKLQESPSKAGGLPILINRRGHFSAG